MINELTILKKLKEVIARDLNDYIERGEEADILTPISGKNVLIDFPDVEQMPTSAMFYIIPDEAQYESLSVESDSSTFAVTVFILCKRDKQDNLAIKTYGYLNALYALLRNNLSLDGIVDFTDITSSDFYPAIEGNKNVQAIEVSVAIRYTKDF